MKNLLKKINDASISLYLKAMNVKDDIEKNIEGSETTEKIGMVVVAVIVIAALATAMRTLMPKMFNTIGNTATNKLNNLMND